MRTAIYEYNLILSIYLFLTHTHCSYIHTQIKHLHTLASLKALSITHLSTSVHTHRHTKVIPTTAGTTTSPGATLALSPQSNCQMQLWEDEGDGDGNVGDG